MTLKQPAPQHVICRSSLNPPGNLGTRGFSFVSTATVDLDCFNTSSKRTTWQRQGTTVVWELISADRRTTLRLMEGKLESIWERNSIMGDLRYVWSALFHRWTEGSKISSLATANSLLDTFVTGDKNYCLQHAHHKGTSRWSSIRQALQDKKIKFESKNKTEYCYWDFWAHRKW